MSSSFMCVTLALQLITLDCPNRRVDVRKLHYLCKPIVAIVSGKTLEPGMPDIVTYARRVTKTACKPKRKP